jgi:hypothetical protein
MIIGAPHIHKKNGTSEIEISAPVQMEKTRRKNFPDRLWFRFPLEFEHLISDHRGEGDPGLQPGVGPRRTEGRGPNPVPTLGHPGLQARVDIDPFVVALLLLAMQYNEPIRVRGTLSYKLLMGLEEYQKIYHAWYPDRFSIVKIEPDGLRVEGLIEARDSSQTEGGSVCACAFSGGVDSFYTFCRLRSDPNFRYALFMAGFDMPLHLTDSIASLTSSYSQLMKKTGVHFISGRTNVRDFVNGVDWTNAHGQALAASALFFSQAWNQFYIPSSYQSGNHPKWGTHPHLDPLLSTEKMELIHHGADANRVQKLRTVLDFPESRSCLRVCWIQDIGLRNCGKCEKCVRTMIALEILRDLGRIGTFPVGALTPQKIRSLTLRTHQARVFARELFWEAVVRGRFSICRDLLFALSRREVFYFSFRLRNWSVFRRGEGRGPNPLGLFLRK